MNVVASFSNSLWKGQPPSKVTYYTIGRSPQVIPLAGGAGKVQAAIPEVDLWGILAFADAPKPADQAAGWTELFDGATLDGWVRKNGTATYRVVDGAIVGRTKDGSWNSFLRTQKEYGDFELEFDVKVDAKLNSGVQIRSKTREHANGSGLRASPVCGAEPKSFAALSEKS